METLKQDIQDLELNKPALEILRFLIKDGAFHEEFLLTTILEYFRNNTHK